jgi:hypothetical protein
MKWFSGFIDMKIKLKPIPDGHSAAYSGLLYVTSRRACWVTHVCWCFGILTVVPVFFNGKTLFPGPPNIQAFLRKRTLLKKQRFRYSSLAFA